MEKPILVNKKTHYKGGRPLGVDRSDNIHLWNKSPLPDNISAMREAYSYGTLRRVFPWARVFRAGFAIIYRDPALTSDSTCELLIVHQKDTEYRAANGEIRVSSLHGLPKGAAEPTDPSALDTAIRETREETGIDIFRSGAKILPSCFVLPRRQHNIEELTIYFVAILSRKPAVRYDNKELCGYHWADMKKGLMSNRNKMSDPTKQVLAALESSDIYYIP